MMSEGTSRLKNVYKSLNSCVKSSGIVGKWIKTTISQERVLALLLYTVHAKLSHMYFTPQLGLTEKHCTTQIHMHKECG